MTCPNCGHYNSCPSCNQWFCEACGEELKPIKSEDKSDGMGQLCKD